MVGGKLILEFGKIYRENYLEKGKLLPVTAQARDETSYQILLKQLNVLGMKLGYQFELEHLGTSGSGPSLRHDVRIVPTFRH